MVLNCERRSIILERIGVTEIGLRSLTPLIGVYLDTGVITAVRHEGGTTPLIGVHLDTGVITAVRHEGGTTPRQKDILTILVTTSDSSLAQSR